MPIHFATVRLKMLLLVACLPLTAQADMGSWERGLSYEARLQDERMTPTVAGDERQLQLFSASLMLRETIYGGLHGGLIGGLPSLGWSAADTEESVRVGGRLFGISLGGRHPEQGPLALVWEGRHVWTEAGGTLGDGELDISLRDTTTWAGLQWWPGTHGITAGITRQGVRGEEFRSDGGQARSRDLRWQAEDHAFVELGLDLGDGGWMSARYSHRQPRASVALVFGRQF